jgi:hypothetical protein
MMTTKEAVEAVQQVWRASKQTTSQAKLWN